MTRKTEGYPNLRPPQMGLSELGLLVQHRMTAVELMPDHILIKCNYTVQTPAASPLRHFLCTK